MKKFLTAFKILTISLVFVTVIGQQTVYAAESVRYNPASREYVFDFSQFNDIFIDNINEPLSPNGCNTGSIPAINDLRIMHGGVPAEWNLCTMPNIQIPECVGADFARGKDGLKFCYWRQTKKFKFMLDTSYFPRGCRYLSDTTNAGTPGGYDPKVGWQGLAHVSNITGKTNGWMDAHYTNLANLKNLYVSSTYTVDSFVARNCGNGDPITTQAIYTLWIYDKVNKMSFIPVFALYDNRPEFNDMTNDYIVKKCQLLVYNNVNYSFVYNMRSSGLYPLKVGEKRYVEIDMLPKIIQRIQTCYSLNGMTVPDLSNFQVYDAIFNNESTGNLSVQYTIEDPRVRFVMKDNAQYQGAVYGIKNSTISGWSFSYDNVSLPNDVHLYKVDSSGNQTFLGAVQTSKTQTDVNDYFKISGNHGFTFNFPLTNLKKGDKIAAYYYNGTNGPSIPLAQSPFTYSVKSKDLNSDGFVNGPDLSIILAKLNNNTQDNLNLYDYSENTKVGTEDLSIFLNDFGK